MELDDAYANAEYIPNAMDYPPRWERQAEAYRRRLSVTGRARLGLMYGHGARETLDLFLPEGPVRGLFVFVHGGYWRRFDRSVWSHLSEGMRANGHAVAMPSYDLCPRVRISDITRQVAAAITVAAHEIAGPVRLAGHSAGGHLVARMLAPGMLPDDVAGRLTHVMPISPLSDLRPFLKTSMNADFKLDENSAIAESPITQPVPDVSVSIRVGGAERPAFIDQARWLSDAWGCSLQIVPDLHHFDIIDALEDPASPAVAQLLS
jgi:acetyl esterase/lipase